MCKHMFSQSNAAALVNNYYMDWTALPFLSTQTHIHVCTHMHNSWTVNNKIKVIVWLKHFTMHDSQ